MAPERTSDGHFKAHPQRFPNGMKAVGDYLHARGLKFGIYSCAGKTTCEGWPASFGHEREDALDFAAWGVDYLKYDFCGLEKVPESQKQPMQLYSVMRDALNATGRPIMFSLCNWGVGQPHLWGHKVGNSWRTGRDVFAVWDEHAARKVHKLPGFLQSIMTAIDDADRSQRTVDGPGGFNDPDMLVVGLEGMTPYGLVEECPTHLPEGSCKPGDYISRQLWGQVGGLTYTEQRTHFAFWCMLASPLMLGNDPRRMTRATARLLMSPGLLAINQDPLGRSARKIWTQGALQIWKKQLHDGSHALLLFNRGNATADIAVVWKRDLHETSAAYEREVARMPPCADNPEVAGCAGWAKGGECAKNPGFMKSNCLKSCDACPPALYEGRQADGLVRDAWEDEGIGIFTARYTAKHVEPHEARVVIVTFGAKEVLERQQADGAQHPAERIAAAEAANAGHGHAGGDGAKGTSGAAVHPHASLRFGPRAAGGLHASSHAMPPALAVCAAEHVDKLLLAVLSIAGVCGLLVFATGAKLARGEAGRSGLRLGVTPSKRGWRSMPTPDSRPHAV